MTSIIGPRLHYHGVTERIAQEVLLRATATKGGLVSACLLWTGRMEPISGPVLLITDHERAVHTGSTAFSGRTYHASELAVRLWVWVEYLIANKVPGYQRTARFAVVGDAYSKPPDLVTSCGRFDCVAAQHQVPRVLALPEAAEAFISAELRFASGGLLQQNTARLKREAEPSASGPDQPDLDSEDSAAVEATNTDPIDLTQTITDAAVFIGMRPALGSDLTPGAKLFLRSAGAPKVQPILADGLVSYTPSLQASPNPENLVVTFPEPNLSACTIIRRDRCPVGKEAHGDWRALVAVTATRRHVGVRLSELWVPIE